uniref:Uncharacterized protein n=1 Tax=viral metagenome TaxID=1070528 RepID=A0A6H1ZGF6_9ZZZZ
MEIKINGKLINHQAINIAAPEIECKFLVKSLFFLADTTPYLFLVKSLNGILTNAVEIGYKIGRSMVEQNG